MEKKDLVLLIEMEDTLEDMDKTLVQLAGHGHASGDFIKLDNVFDVIQNNSHEYYADKSEDTTQLFMSILMSREKTPEERADILMSGTVRLK